MSLLPIFHKDCEHYRKVGCPGCISNNGIPPLAEKCKYYSGKSTKPEKTYTAALREKLKIYFDLYPDLYECDKSKIENAIKAIVRLNKKYGKE